MNDSHILTFKEWLKENPNYAQLYAAGASLTVDRAWKKAQGIPPEEDGFPYHYTLPEE